MVEIMVTGADGFVGHHLVELLHQEYKVAGLVGKGPLPKVSGNLSYDRADITDIDRLNTIITKYKSPVIIHLAAVAATWKEDGELFKVNVEGTRNLYQVVSNIDGYDPKIIFASSGVVYGNTPHPGDIREGAEVLPINPYGQSKYQAEEVGKEYVTQGLNIIAVRCFNLAGPGQGLGFFVPDMCKQIVDIERGEGGTGSVSVGHLGATRDILDVRDAVQAYKILINSDTKPGEVFNICSGVGHKMEEVLDILMSLSTKKITTIQDPKRMRRSETPIFVGNNEKLKSLGWNIQYPLGQTLEDALNFWRNKP